DLARVSDAVYSNLRGDQPERLRLSFDPLKDGNERIVCCSLSGFGMTGRRARQGGYDYMMQGIAGWQSLTGGPDDPPTKSGISLVDLSGGYVAAVGVLGGLWGGRLRYLPAGPRAAGAGLLRDVGALPRLRPSAPAAVGARGDRPLPE